MARTNYGSLVFITRHAANATFNTLIPYHMLSEYRAALVATHHVHRWLNGDVYISKSESSLQETRNKSKRVNMDMTRSLKSLLLWVLLRFFFFFLSWPLKLIVFSLQDSIDDHRGLSDRWQARISCQILIDLMYCDTYSEEETCLPHHTNCGRDKVRPQLEWESRK